MNSNIKDIFDKNIIGSVATLNEDGSPWSTPVHVITDGENVYWFSPSSAQHSVNVKRDPRVSLVLFNTDITNGTKSVYVSGNAHEVEASDIDVVREVFASRAGKFPEYFMSASAYKLPLGSLDSEKSSGERWYFHS